MKQAHTQQEEVDQNYEAFKKMLPKLVDSDEGRFALLHDSKLIACFDTSHDARQAGEKLLKGQLFSIQKITDKPVDLGCFSHAGIIGVI